MLEKNLFVTYTPDFQLRGPLEILSNKKELYMLKLG